MVTDVDFGVTDGKNREKVVPDTSQKEYFPAAQTLILETVFLILGPVLIL
jgi:hypothetical protein